MTYLLFDAIWMCCMHYWRHQSKSYIPCPFSLSIFLFVYSYDCPVYFSKCCLPMPKLIFLGGLLCCVKVIVHAIQMRWPSLVCKVEKKCNGWNSFFPYISLYLEKWPLVTVWSFASLKMHQIQWNKKQNKDKWMYLIVDNFILVLDGRGKGKLICYTHALALSSQKKFKCIFFWMTWLDDCCK